MNGFGSGKEVSMELKPQFDDTVFQSNGTITPEAIRNHVTELAKEPANGLDALLEKALIDLSKEYPKPDSILLLDQYGKQIPMLTRGSISATIGKAKSGKTTFMALAVGAILSGNTSGLTQFISGDTEGTVLYIDSEQGVYYASLTAHRIKALAGDPHRLKYYDLREYSPDKRMELIRHAIKQEENIALIIIDGGRDIIYDINSPEEAINTVTELMEISVTYHTHINVVLHQNKGDGNARGHFGTELVNKSELVLAINKSPDDESVSVVHAEFSRGMPFDDFAIMRDDEGMPFIGDTLPEKVNTKPSRIDKIETICKEVFGGQKSLQYNKAIEEIMRVSGKGERTAKDYFKEIKAHKMVFQSEDGNYRLSDFNNDLINNEL